MRAPDWLTARPVAHRGLHDISRGIVENMPGAVQAGLHHRLVRAQAGGGGGRVQPVEVAKLDHRAVLLGQLGDGRPHPQTGFGAVNLRFLGAGRHGSAFERHVRPPLP